MTFALLDTNALLPARLSDILFDCASQGLYFPRWTRAIEDEFINNWGDVCLSVSKSDRRARKKAKLMPPPEHVTAAKRRLSCFRAAVGLEWEVIGYENVDVLERVPADVDKADVPHVAACIVLLDALSEELVSGKVFLVSNNLKDLSVRKCASLGIVVLTPRQFLDAMTIVDPFRMEIALRQSLIDLKNFSIEDLLSVLKIHKAQKAARLMAKVIRLF